MIELITVGHNAGTTFSSLFIAYTSDCWGNAGNKETSSLRKIDIT